MSWSVSTKGTPEEVANRLTEQFSAITYLTSPEAELKDSAKALMLQAVAAQKGVAEMSVSGFGSADKNGDKESQSVTVTVSTNGFTQ